MYEDEKQEEKVYDNPLMMSGTEYDQYMREKYAKENRIERENK